MRQLLSRVFDLALGAAVALLLIGSVDTRTDVASAKAVTGIPLQDAYSAEVVEPPPPIPIDPKAQYLIDLVRQGRHWRLDTDHGPIHVWAPPGYIAESAQTIVYVHGYWQDADVVWHEHRLAEQFALSGANALFVVPEAPRGKWDPVLWPTANAVLADVARGIGEKLPKGRVAVIGHSGAYRTVIPWLADPKLDTVVLLDAAYVDVMPYRKWLIGSKKRRFLNVSIDTIKWSNWLHAYLPSTQTHDAFPREITDKMKTARILYIKSDIGHWPLVTEGVALPAMVRALNAPSALAGDEPSLGLPLPEGLEDPGEPEVGDGAGEIPEERR